MCAVEGCRLAVVNVGMCRAHYLRTRRHGSPTAYFPNAIRSRLARMDVKGKTIPQLAAELNVTPDAVRRALKRLREAT